MPVRSLSSPVLKWPDRQTVEAALRRWAAKVCREHPRILGLGYFGSYARGDWGVGSDLHIVIILAKSDDFFETQDENYNAWKLPD